MKRVHLHARVTELESSIAFYSKIFAAPPTVVKDDYAKWMLEDPLVNFAISQRDGAEIGIDHVGIQVSDEGELAEVYLRMGETSAPQIEEGSTTCCYAKSEKSWVSDPDGLMWEVFLTKGSSTVYGNSANIGALLQEKQQGGVTSAACCGA